MKTAKTILMISAVLLTFIVTKQLNVMQDTEIWKSVPGYEGYYDVSDKGRVRSVSIRTPFGGFQLRANPKILSFEKISGNYLSVKLQKDGLCKKVLVHRLVLLTFIGDSDLQCDHINAIRTDNRLINLRWVTPKQNVQYSLARRQKVTQI